jgi:branched-chain amino acid transport system permease protein
MPLFIEVVIQGFLNGLGNGGLYALTAVGYSLVFGMLKMVNFAHGEIFTVGAYLLLLFLKHQIPIALAFPLSIFLTGFISYGIEVLIYRPLRNKSRLAPLITAVGLSIFLQNFIQLLATATPRPYPFLLTGALYEFGSDRFFLFYRDLIILAVTLILTIGTDIFFHKTKFGLAVRAVASDLPASEVCGLPINGSISIVFFISGALACVAGGLQGMSTNLVMPTMGVAVGLKAFASAVLGGVGSLWGAFWGGLSLGVIESLISETPLSSFKEGLAFLVLIFVLMVKPEGLFGLKRIEKV